MACGISIGLTSIYLSDRGMTKQSIGLLSLFFGAGLVLFAIPVGALIRRFSAERMLAACLLVYSVCLAAFPFMPDFSSLAAIRFVDGLASVGVWVSSETILLAQSRREHKAYLTTLYAIWLASGYVLGPVSAAGMAKYLPATIMFGVAALFALGGGLFVALKMPPAPPIEGGSHEEKPTEEGKLVNAAEMSVGTILWRIKTSCFAAFSYGYFQASVVIFLPLYLRESKSVPQLFPIILPGLFCLGMMVFSNLAGRVADKVGHLKAVRVLSMIGLACIVGFIFLDNYVIMGITVIATGGSFASMSPIALALTGVIVEPRDYSRANAIYNMFYAAGILMGPPISSVIFQKVGGVPMLYHEIALWAVFVLFTMIFMYDDPAARTFRDGKTAVGRKLSKAA